MNKVILATLALAGCVTPAQKLATAPSFEVTSARALSEVQGCLTDQIQRTGAKVQYLPTANGGRFTHQVKATTIWVIDVSDEGSQRRVALHSTRSIFGEDDETPRMIRACI